MFASHEVVINDKILSASWLHTDQNTRHEVVINDKIPSTNRTVIRLATTDAVVFWLKSTDP